MKTINGPSRIAVRSTRHRALEPISYQAIIAGLVSEMAYLIRTTETRPFSAPFNLVMLDNRGCIAFAGQVDQEGKMRPSGPFRKVRRSHFPVSAFITDRSLVTRTFRIDHAALKGTYR